MSRPDRCGRELGFTLVELLVTMLISGVLLMLTLGIVNGNRRLYDTDSRRVEINQNLQSALRIMSNDVRQTGERLGRSFPALEVVSGSSDTLTIRRNLLDVALPLCKSLNAGASSPLVYVAAQAGKTGADCQAASPAVVGPWKTFRESEGGSVSAFIFDPVLRRGQSFTYAAEDPGGQFIRSSGGAWQYDYDTDNAPVIYLVETRTYAVTGTQLTLSLDGAAAEPVSPNITALKVPLTLQNGTEVSGDYPTAGTTWKDVRSVHLTLSGAATSQGKTTTRSLSESVTPRNAYSAED